jgi:hypothetical protein
MPEQAAQQGHAALQGGGRPVAGPNIPKGRPSSRSNVIGVSVAGALLTAVAIAGVVMMTGSGSAPVTTQVAAVSAPQMPAVAPAMVPASIAPAQAIAPITNFVPALPPVADPATTGNIAQSFASVLGPAQTPQPSASDQCGLRQSTQLALNVYASNSEEDGNRVRFIVGSYVSPVFTITRSPQIVTFPVPAGSRGSAQMVVEQQKARGATWDGIDGLDLEFGPTSLDHLRTVVNLHWMPRC